MSDLFSQLIPDARAVPGDLARHNSRAWFRDHKARYDDTVKTPATLLPDHMAPDLRRTAGDDLSLTPNLFRPHRDARVSKDKTQSRTHLHMMRSPGPAGPTNPALFFGISLSYVRLGGAVMGFAKDGLSRWRAALDDADGNTIQQNLTHLSRHGYAPPDLKRVPAPFDKHHPRADLLRHKGIAVWRDLPASHHAAPVDARRQAFKRLHPLLTRLRPIA